MKSPKGVNGQTNGIPGSMPEDLRARQSVLADKQEEIANFADRIEDEASQAHNELPD